MHQLDQLKNVISRERIRVKLTLEERRVVLGEPLRKTSIYASMTMVLGGHEHDFPIIVVSCIEELYRTGIYQFNLFRTLPNRSRLLELINISLIQRNNPREVSFDLNSHSVKSGFGASTSLHLESTPDICALLSTYLSALPQPILLPALFRPIWDWCRLEDEADALQLKPFRRRISSVPLSRTYTNPTESAGILVAQLVLHLLPLPHFSLLVYILAFFSQVAMVHEENGVGIEDLAHMFGVPDHSSGRDTPFRPSPRDDTSRSIGESENIILHPKTTAPTNLTRAMHFQLVVSRVWVTRHSLFQLVT